MPSATALLLSNHAPLIESVRAIVRPFANVHFDVVNGIREGCSRVAEDNVVLVLVHLPRGGDVDEVIRLLQLVTSTRRPIATLVVSDEHHAEQALTVLRLGAADYLSRPLDLARLTYLIDTLTLRARYAAPAPSPAAETAAASGDEQNQFFCLSDEPMGHLMDLVRRVAPQETTLLLMGETGTGKTSLARLVHGLSPRRAQPFLGVNCAALPENLIESELFGHVKGAFTGAERDRVGRFATVGRGTLLLDEVDALPLALQAKLLHAVEARTFEPVGSNQAQAFHGRLIAASNRRLEDEVAAGRFRSDLYYRLNVVGFYLPPLRERRAVIGPLTRRFVAECARRMGRSVPAVARTALEALQEHSWPGNIRELRNALERAVALCLGHEIQCRDLPPASLAAPQPSRDPCAGAFLPSNRVDAPHANLFQVKIETETACIVEALQKHKNNRLRAAAELGISRMTLYKKLRKYGLMEPI